MKLPLRISYDTPPFEGEVHAIVDANNLVIFDSFASWINPEDAKAVVEAFNLLKELAELNPFDNVSGWCFVCGTYKPNHDIGCTWVRAKELIE